MVISMHLSIWGSNFGLFDRKSEQFLRAGEPKPRSCRGVPRQDPGSQGRIRAKSAGRPWLKTAMMAAAVAAFGWNVGKQWKTLVKVVWGKFCGTSLACLAAQNSRILLWFERLRGCYLPRSGQQRFLPAELRNSLRWRGTVFGCLWCFTWIAFQTGYGSLKVQGIVRS